MKLLITQSNLTLKGGAERVVLKIAQHYKAKIYTAEYNPDATFEGFRDLDVNVIGRLGPSSLSYGRVTQGLNYGLTFYNLKLKEDYDVINAHVSPSHWIRNNNPGVLWYCHTPLRDVYDLYNFRLSFKRVYEKPVYVLGAAAVRTMDKNVVKKIELVLANSKNTQTRLLKYLKKNSMVLNGGVDYKDYKQGDPQKYFLYPSRISPNKRQDYAINAFKLFRKSDSKFEGYKLILVGDVSKDKFYYDYYKSIERLAGDVGNVELLTDVDDDKLKVLYAGSTGVLFTAINEDYGLIPLEAMASGKPIISVNEGGPKETVVNGKTGFLVNNEREMANKMKFVAEHSSVARELGKNGTERVRRNYSWGVFFKKFDIALEKVKKGD